MRAERVRNPRVANNLSGSLALQLWLLAEPYRGGSFTGTLLASAALGRVHGQSAIEPGEQEVALTEAGAAAGSRAVLMLREWTAEGYLTRDYWNFAEPYGLAVTVPEPVTEAVVVPEPVAAAVTEAVAVPEPAAVAEPVQVTDSVAGAGSVAVADSVADSAPASTAMLEAAVTPTAVVEAPQAATQPLSLNRASADELVRATGISKKLAGDVIKARPYKSFGELTRVRGIGEKTVRKFREALTL